MKKWCELFISSIDINRTNSPKFLNPDGYERARYMWNSQLLFRPVTTTPTVLFGLIIKISRADGDG